MSDPMRVSPARLAWLTEESARWQADGLVDPETRARILAGYDAVPIERRGLQAIVIIALLMCAVGVLLLIGYNWDRIPREGRVAMLIGSTAVAFAGAVLAYSRDRAALGEWLAFAGTLLYGCSIWLIAQVLNISAHFPDGFLWWMLGAGVTASLLRSRIILVAAATLMICWMAPETVFFQRQLWLLFPVVVVMALLAYRLDSALTVVATALAIALWCGATAMRWNTPASFGFDLLLVTGALLYAIGRRHPRPSRSAGSTRDRLGLVWQASGLTTMVVALAALMMMGLYDTYGGHDAVPVRGLVMLSVMTAASYLLLVPFGVERGDAAVLATAGVGMISALLLAPGRPLFESSHGYAPVLAFSACALALSLAFVWSAVRRDRFDQLCFGVLFAVAFLFVRWMSIIGNMAWSALLMLATGAALLLIARAWRARPHLLERSAS